MSAGYAGASLSRIAEAAGIRKASLYHHFDTKEALYLAVMDDVIADLQGVFVEAVASQGDLLNALMLPAAISYLARQPDAAKILLRKWSMAVPLCKRTALSYQLHPGCCCTVL